jgi:flagellar protein FlgJ
MQLRAIAVRVGPVGRGVARALLRVYLFTRIFGNIRLFSIVILLGHRNGVSILRIEYLGKIRTRFGRPVGFGAFATDLRASESSVKVQHFYALSFIRCSEHTDNIVTASLPKSTMTERCESNWSEFMKIISQVPKPPVATEHALRSAAKEMEANFLAEMLKSAGFGKTPESFGGGAGEDQFGSFMRLEQARQIVQSGGIGLAETLFHSLKERAND